MTPAKFTLFWIPSNGLFRDGAYFTDGEGRRIAWDKTIPMFDSHERAVVVRDKIIAKHPSAKGELVIMNVVPRSVA